MGMRAGETINGTDVMRFLIANAKIIPTIMGTIAIILFIGWKVYGQDEMQKFVKKEIEPVKEEVESIKKNQKNINFTTKKIELMLIKALPDSIVQQAEKEAEIFRD